MAELADATDLKSVSFYRSMGSSPIEGIMIYDIFISIIFTYIIFFIVCKIWFYEGGNDD